MTANEEPPRKLAFFGRPTFGGALLAVVFWWRSLYPTLMPRSVVAQGAICAVCAGLGYMIGTLAGHVGHRLLQHGDKEPTAAQKARAWQVLGVLAAVVVVPGSLLLWPNWQNDQRDLLDMDHIGRASALPVVVVGLVLLVVLGLLGRLIGRGVQRLHRFNTRHLPASLAAPATIVLVLALGVFVLRDVVGDALVDRANSAFGAGDKDTKEGISRPSSSLLSGSPESLVAWDELGYQGRTFVGEATPTKELSRFWGPDVEVTAPIRAYVGLRSADDVDARAALAVEELERTGAFDRSVLVVATSTGTGWIDPDASLALEMVHKGDTAIVSMQYSFLPSWISSLVDTGNAQAAGAALYDAVYDRWKALPAGDRPKLLAFGLSLGSYGGEAAFAGVDGRTSVANLAARSDGALFVGATNGNTIWRQLTDGRDAGSPVWQPVFDGGKTVRFDTRGPDANDLPKTWSGPRVLYFQHPSDPVTFWSADTFWSKPEWMDSPRGHDVATQGGWFPIVTGTQGVFDLMAGFGAPPGFGHDYRLDYVDAWAQVLAPDGWTAADRARLEAFLTS